MSLRSACVVVDASVGVKLFLPEELSEEAADLFGAAARDRGLSLIVPDLFFPECGNVLWTAARRIRVSPSFAVQAVRDLTSLELTVLPSGILIQQAVRTAFGRGISVYDATYVAASTAMDAALITADRRLVERMAGSCPPVLWLGSWRVD